MAELSRILAPVEFSPRCQGAVQFAEALASHYQSELILLHVVMPPVLPYGSADALLYTSAADLSEERLEESRDALDGFLADELKDARARRVVLEGDPAREIAEFATSEECGLIVMPTHGHGPFRRFLLGSVTAKVLHDAHCPVWTGPHLERAPAHENIQFRRVLCAVDFGPQTRVVLCWAAQFAREFQAELAIAHVVPFSTVRLGGFYFDPEWRMELIHKARARIDYLKSEMNLEAEPRIVTGEVAESIADQAREWHADLVVIGRGHATGGAGRLRAHAYGIIRDSPCPVVAI